MEQRQVEQARAEADRARQEHARGHAGEGFAHRLETLESAIAATSEAMQWRQKAVKGLDVAAQKLELAQVVLYESFSASMVQGKVIFY